MAEHKNPDFWKRRYEDLTSLISEAEEVEDTNRAIELTSRRDHIVKELTAAQKRELGIS